MAEASTSILGRIVAIGSGVLLATATLWLALAAALTLWVVVSTLFVADREGRLPLWAAPIMGMVVAGALIAGTAALAFSALIRRLPGRRRPR
jgi:hypothetical protein